MTLFELGQIILRSQMAALGVHTSMNNKTIQSKLHCGKDIVIKFKNMDDLDPLNFVDDQKNDRPQTKTNKYIESHN